MTYWYEIYYDVWLGGQYFKKIAEMHEKYGKLTTQGLGRWPTETDMFTPGPIVRINPHEVHFNDPEFIDPLYPGPARKTDKYMFTGRRTGSKDATLSRPTMKAHHN